MNLSKASSNRPSDKGSREEALFTGSEREDEEEEGGGRGEKEKNVEIQTNKNDLGMTGNHSGLPAAAVETQVVPGPSALSFQAVAGPGPSTMAKKERKAAFEFNQLRRGRLEFKGDEWPKGGHIDANGQLQGL